jgi:transglutaminase-like putative cysteine protease
MPLLAVRHVTTYRYRQPVAFGEHRMMLRPREGHDQRILEARLEITPAPVELRWLHDVFGNSVAVARFSGRASELRFESYVRLDHQPSGADDLHLDETGATWPFSYGPDEVADLSRTIERHFPDPEREIDRWARRFARSGGPTDTLELLSGITHAIRDEFTYIAREGGGTQPPG